MMDSRGIVSQEQIMEDTERMTFGIELECIAVYPQDLFENDERNPHGDAIAALSLACLDRGIKSTGHEDENYDEESDPDFYTPYAKWSFKNEGGLRLSEKEREAVPTHPDYMIQSLEVCSRLLSFESDDWKQELKTVLEAFGELSTRGARFVTNATTGFHIHIGFGSEIMPLRTAKSVLELCTGFEDRLDALYSTSRIDENAATRFPDGRHFNAGLAWHFKNNEKTELNSNIFHWLTSIEEASSFEELGNFFRNCIPNSSGHTTGHYSQLNLDNLFAAPHAADDPEDVDPIGTIEFRQHGGTLDFDAIVSHVLLKQALFKHCHTATDKEFLQLIAHVPNPTFRLSDLIRAIGGGNELLHYYEKRRSFATSQVQEADYKGMIEALNDGRFDDSSLLKLGAQAFIEDHERNNWTAVANKIQAKHQAGAYAQMQIRDFDITGEWDSFLWFNSDKIPAEQLTTLARVMVFQQLNGDDMEFDCTQMSDADEEMEDV